MKLHLKGVFWLWLVLLISSCELIMPEVKTENLNGRVASFTSTKYRATEKFGKPQKGEISGRQHTVWEKDMSNVKIEFNREGERTTITRFDKNKKVISKDIRQENEIKMFDGNNVLMGTMILDGSDKPQQVSLVNRNGRQEGLIEIEYDERGNRILEKFYDEVGALDMFSQFSYDSNDRLKVQREGRIFVTRGPRLSQGIRRDTVIAEFKFKRDDLGNPIEINSSVNDEISKFTFEYTFDDRQNWVTGVRKKNGRIDALYERKIVYYEE